MISIITNHSVFDKGVKFKIIEAVNGRSEQYVTIGDGKGNFYYRLSLNARKDDGFKKRYDSKELAGANFRGDYQASNNDILTFSFNYNSGDYQEEVVDRLDLNANVPEHVKKSTRSSFSGKWTHNFSNSDILTLNYYQQEYNDSNSFIGDYTTEGFGLVLIDESFTTNRKNIEMTYSKYADSYSLIVGSLYRIDNTIAPQYLYQVDKDIHTKQYFVNTEIQLNKNNIINAGLLYDDNDTGGATTSPRVAFNHQINKSNTVRVSYAESSRSPFALEEYTNRVVNIPPLTTLWTDLSDLKPELVKTYDIGYISKIGNATDIDMLLDKNHRLLNRGKQRCCNNIIINYGRL